jgi:2-C-methyl-D-erythritol 4-phosphate cytidylyltransferase
MLITIEEQIEYCWKEIVKKHGFTKVTKILAGGDERQDSVYRGLKEMDENVDYVAVHDGVRPLISRQTISDVLNEAFEKGSAIVGVPAKDTIKIANQDLTVQGTPPRQSLWHIQTPQVFKKDIIMRAYTEAEKSGWRGTDDASLVERLGEKVHIVKGDYDNIKITTPEDLVFFREAFKLRNEKS